MTRFSLTLLVLALPLAACDVSERIESAPHQTQQDAPQDEISNPILPAPVQDPETPPSASQACPEPRYLAEQTGLPAGEVTYYDGLRYVDCAFRDGADGVRRCYPAFGSVAALDPGAHFVGHPGVHPAYARPDAKPRYAIETDDRGLVTKVYELKWKAPENTIYDTRLQMTVLLPEEWFSVWVPGEEVHHDTFSRRLP